MFTQRREDKDYSVRLSTSHSDQNLKKRDTLKPDRPPSIGILTCECNIPKIFGHVDDLDMSKMVSKVLANEQ